MRLLSTLLFLATLALPASAQTDTLRAGGTPTTSWTLPAAYTALGSAEEAGPLAFPTEDAAFSTGYAVRFVPTSSGALDGVRLWIDGLAPGRLAQKNGTLRAGEAPRFQWPIPFDHVPGQFNRQAVRFTGTGDDLVGLSVGVGEATTFSELDSLRVSFFSSQFQVGALETYASDTPAGRQDEPVDSLAVRFTAPTSGLLHSFDLGIDAIAFTTNQSVRPEVKVVASQTVPPTEVRYYLGGSSFTFALGISGDVRQAYGVRFTAPGDIGGPAAPLESAEFYVFNINDDRFFTGFDTPANDSLVVTAYATDDDGLPTDALASQTIAFPQLRQLTFNRVDFSESGVEVSPGEDIVIGFQTKVVGGNDIVSFIGGGTPDVPLERTLVRTPSGWSSVFDSEFYAGRLDRGDEIRVRAFFTDPASGGPSASATALAHGGFSSLNPELAELDEGLEVTAGQEFWVILTGEVELLDPPGGISNYPYSYDLFEPTSARRYALPDGVGGWTYVPGEIPDIRAVYGEGELPSGDTVLGDDVIVALKDLAPTGGTLRRSIGFQDAPIPTVEGEDYWVVFDVIDDGDDARFALVSGEPARTQTNQSAAFVSSGLAGDPNWTFVQNTLFGEPYEFDVTAYYDAFADALDDDFVLAIHELGEDGYPGAMLSQMSLPLAEIGDPNADFAGFVDVPTFRLKYNVEAGTQFFLALGLEPNGGYDSVSFGAGEAPRGSGPNGFSIGYVEGIGWTILTEDGLVTYLTADALVNTGRVVSVEDAGGVDELRLTAPYPNPLRAGESATFAFALPSAGLVDAAVFDVLGREVARLAHGAAYGAGEQTLSWRADVAPGVYVVRLRADGGVRTARLVVTR